MGTIYGKETTDQKLKALIDDLSSRAPYMGPEKREEWTKILAKLPAVVFGLPEPELPKPQEVKTSRGNVCW